MISWNHRVIRDKQSGGGDWLAVYEVYYQDDGTPIACTRLIVEVAGETIEDLRQQLDQMCRALGEPVLDMAVFK